MQRSNERLYRGQELNELAAGSAGRRSRGWASLAALEGRGELCGRLGSRASRRGLKYVFIFFWHAITGYWGVVRPGTTGMDQYISRMQFPKISPGVSSLPAAVQASQPRELRPASARVRGGRASSGRRLRESAAAARAPCQRPCERVGPLRGGARTPAGVDASPRRPARGGRRAAAAGPPLRRAATHGEACVQPAAMGRKAHGISEAGWKLPLSSPARTSVVSSASMHRDHGGEPPAR